MLSGISAMSRLGRLFMLIGVGGLLFALCLAALVPGVSALSAAPQGESDLKVELSDLAQATVVYDTEGNVIGRLGLQDRQDAKLAEVPPLMVNAVIATEDRTFWVNPGVDFPALVRALFRNVGAGGVQQGGSTITQQLVKNRILTPKRDLSRKLREMLLALRANEELTKEEILEQYLNTVYFGQGSYGIKAATSRFFTVTEPNGVTRGKRLDELTLPEVALLAGVINNPEGSNPFEFPERAKVRRAQVLDTMVAQGFATEADAAAAKDAPLPTKKPPAELKPDNFFVEEVQRRLLADPRLGATQQERYNRVLRGGLKVYSTFNPRAQQLAQSAVDDNLPNQPTFTAAMVAMSPENGEVQAIVGGPDFQNAKYNLATQGSRQPGSTYKVITLAAAIEAGYSPNDTVDGSSPCKVTAKGYAPWDTANAEPFSGSVTTLRQATVGSVNCAFGHLIAALGPAKVADMAKRMGIKGTVPEYLSITLGTAEASPLEMTTVFNTLAADGVRHDPVFVRRVENYKGEVLFEEKNEGVRVMDAQVARTVTDMLEGTISGGTGTRAQIGRPQAGKTGTSEKNGDAWFCGYTPDETACVWMGAPVGRISMARVGAFSPVYGGTYPAIIWKAFMAPWLQDTPENGFGDPDRSKWPAGKFISDNGRGVAPPPEEESTTTSSSTPSASTTPTTGASTTTTAPAPTTTAPAPTTTTTAPPGP